MELAQRQPDGSTLLEHLRVAARMGNVDERLAARPVPRAARAIWQAFMAIGAQRRPGMALHPLALVDIEAWCRMVGVRLTPWELETLLAIDAAAMAVSRRKGDAK